MARSIKSHTKFRNKRAKSDAVAANLLRTFDAHADDADKAVCQPVTLDDLASEECDAEGVVEGRWRARGEAGVRELAEETAALERAGEEALQRAMRSHYPDFIRLSAAVEDERVQMQELRRALADVAAAVPEMADDGVAQDASSGAAPDTPMSRLRAAGGGEGGGGGGAGAVASGAPTSSPARQRSKRRGGAVDAWEETLRQLDILLGSLQMEAAARALRDAEAQAARQAASAAGGEEGSVTTKSAALAERRAQLFKLRCDALRAPGVPRDELRAGVAAALALGGGAAAVTVLLDAHTLRLRRALGDGAHGPVVGAGARHGLASRCALISRAAFAAVSAAAEDCARAFGGGDGGGNEGREVEATGMYASALVKWALWAASEAAACLHRDVFAEAAAVGGFSVVAESYAIALAHAAELQRRRGLCLDGPLRDTLWPCVARALADAVAALDASLPAVVIALRHEALGEAGGGARGDDREALGDALEALAAAARHVCCTEVVAQAATLLGGTCEAYCTRLTVAVDEVAAARMAAPSAATLLSGGGGGGGGSSRAAAATRAELTLVAHGARACEELIPGALVAIGGSGAATAGSAAAALTQEGGSNADGGKLSPSVQSTLWAAQRHGEALRERCAAALATLRTAAVAARVRSLARAHLLLRAEAYAQLDAVADADADANTDGNAELYPSPCLNALAMALLEVHEAARLCTDSPGGGRRGAVAYVGDVIAGLLGEMETLEGALWAPLESGERTLGAVGLKQLCLDAHFLLSLAAVKGWDTSKGIRTARRAAGRLAARALRCHCKATGADPAKALPQDREIEQLARRAAAGIVDRSAA